MPAASRANLQPYTSVLAALDAVRHGEADAAMVPLENSVEGPVNATLDELATGGHIVLREVRAGLEFCAAGAARDRAEKVRRWRPIRMRRCSVGGSRPTYPRPSSSAPSTGAAVALAAEPRGEVDAAVAAPIAGDRYRLAVLAADREDNPDAIPVRLVGRPTAPGRHRRGQDVAGRLHRRRSSWCLLEVLTEFAVRGINLTRIESRPTGERFGHYCFSIDCEGHVDDARVGEALMGLRRVCADVRFLGSYARADGNKPRVRPGVSDVEFRDATAWLARIRDGRA
jgi:prephenate dehydratase